MFLLLIKATYVCKSFVLHSIVLSCITIIKLLNTPNTEWTNQWIQKLLSTSAGLNHFCVGLRCVAIKKLRIDWDSRWPQCRCQWGKPVCMSGCANCSGKLGSSRGMSVLTLQGVAKARSGRTLRRKGKMSGSYEVLLNNLSPHIMTRHCASHTQSVVQIFYYLANPSLFERLDTT